MCDCKDIPIGSYKNVRVLIKPEHMDWYKKRTITVDTCIVDEIKSLWRMGVTTYGCCCGHNLVEPMVNVDDRDIPLMLELGYKQNHPDKTRKDTFRLKSV